MNRRDFLNTAGVGVVSLMMLTSKDYRQCLASLFRQI
jgi:hypothetical protein